MYALRRQYMPRVPTQIVANKMCRGDNICRYIRCQLTGHATVEWKVARCQSVLSSPSPSDLQWLLIRKVALFNWLCSCSNSVVDSGVVWDVRWWLWERIWKNWQEKIRTKEKRVREESEKEQKRIQKKWRREKFITWIRIKF